MEKKRIHSPSAALIGNQSMPCHAMPCHSMPFHAPKTPRIIACELPRTQRPFDGTRLSSTILRVAYIYHRVYNAMRIYRFVLGMGCFLHLPICAYVYTNSEHTKM